MHDWWIYGLLSGLSVVVSFLYCPSSFLWRLATSAAIVLGTLQALFLTWTIYSLKSSPLVEDDCHQSSNVLPEGISLFTFLGSKILFYLEYFNKFLLLFNWKSIWCFIKKYFLARITFLVSELVQFFELVFELVLVEFSGTLFHEFYFCWKPILTVNNFLLLNQFKIFELPSA